MDGFLASLGNKLYTTDASDEYVCMGIMTT